MVRSYASCAVQYDTAVLEYGRYGQSISINTVELSRTELGTLPLA
jgi:hypothetical protein